MGRIQVAMVAGWLVGSSGLAAQQRSSVSVAVTPFFGLANPMRDLLLRPGLDALRDPESQALYGTVGARVTVDVSKRFAVEADIGLGKSGLKVSSLSAPSGTNVKVSTLSGRLVYRLRPTNEAAWFAAHAGVASVRRTFSENSGVPSRISDGSNVGGVLGATLGFRLADRAALTITADDFLYNAGFDVLRSGGTKTRSLSLTQNDLRVTLGVRFVLVGR